MPVSSEICAFQVSTGSISRYSSRHWSSSTSTSCDGMGSDTPPRAASWASRSSPTVFSRASVDPSGARSTWGCTPA